MSASHYRASTSPSSRALVTTVRRIQEDEQMRVHSHRQTFHWLGSIVVSLIALAAPALAQQATLQGRVSTGVNQPLPDSRIIVVGTMTSAVTNAEGRFVL